MRQSAPDSTPELARLCILLFAASTAFPVTAGLLNPVTPSRLLGVADVVVGVLLFVASATIASRRRGKVTSHDQIRAFGVSQIVFASIPALLIVFFVVGERIDWRVLVIGLAWRGWLLLYTLPYLISATRTRRTGESADRAGRS